MDKRIYDIASIIRIYINSLEKNKNEKDKIPILKTLINLNELFDSNLDLYIKNKDKRKEIVEKANDNTSSRLNKIKGKLRELDINFADYEEINSYQRIKERKNSRSENLVSEGINEFLFFIKLLLDNDKILHLTSKRRRTKKNINSRFFENIKKEEKDLNLSIFREKINGLLLGVEANFDMLSKEEFILQILGNLNDISPENEMEEILSYYFHPFKERFKVLSKVYGNSWEADREITQMLLKYNSIETVNKIREEMYITSDFTYYSTLVNKYHQKLISLYFYMDIFFIENIPKLKKINRNFSDIVIDVLTKVKEKEESVKSDVINIVNKDYKVKRKLKINLDKNLSGKKCGVYLLQFFDYQKQLIFDYCGRNLIWILSFIEYCSFLKDTLEIFEKVEEMDSLNMKLAEDKAIKKLKKMKFEEIKPIENIVLEIKRKKENIEYTEKLINSFRMEENDKVLEKYLNNIEIKNENLFLYSCYLKKYLDSDVYEELLRFKKNYIYLCQEIRKISNNIFVDLDGIMNLILKIIK